jgi:type II secretory pathway pseudopilin PulG
MTRVSQPLSPHRSPACIRRPGAFSLIEVVLAIGVLSLAVVAMLGLFAPTMNSVKQVVDGNKATALVGMINAQVNEKIAYNDIGDGLKGGADAIMYFYAWERENASGGIDIVMSDPGSSKPGSTDVSTGSSVASPKDDKANLAGPAFVVTFERLELGAGNYDYTKYTDEAYIPFLVTIYQLDLDEGFNKDHLNEATRVISYPSAKLR